MLPPFWWVTPRPPPPDTPDAGWLSEIRIMKLCAWKRRYVWNNQLSVDQKLLIPQIKLYWTSTARDTCSWCSLAAGHSLWAWRTVWPLNFESQFARTWAVHHSNSPRTSCVGQIAWIPSAWGCPFFPSLESREDMFKKMNAILLIRDNKLYLLYTFLINQCKVISPASLRWNDFSSEKQKVKHAMLAECLVHS